jgi:hypothetical protein
MVVERKKRQVRGLGGYYSELAIAEVLIPRRTDNTRAAQF